MVLQVNNLGGLFGGATWSGTLEVLGQGQARCWGILGGVLRVGVFRGEAALAGNLEVLGGFCPLMGWWTVCDSPVGHSGGTWWVSAWKMRPGRQREGMSLEGLAVVGKASRSAQAGSTLWFGEGGAGRGMAVRGTVTL